MQLAGKSARLVWAKCTHDRQAMLIVEYPQPVSTILAETAYIYGFVQATHPHDRIGD